MGDDIYLARVSRVAVRLLMSRILEVDGSYEGYVSKKPHFDTVSGFAPFLRLPTRRDECPHNRTRTKYKVSPRRDQRRHGGICVSILITPDRQKTEESFERRTDKCRSRL
jgi:hypothetical protein